MNHDTALARLDEANACHDDNAERAAALLRTLDAAALPAERLAHLAFLLNHVLGEKLGAWPEAHALHARVLAAAGDAPAAPLWRQAAAAAQVAGDAHAAQRLAAALAEAAGTPPGAAQDVVELTVAMYRVPALAPAAAADCARRALRLLDDVELWRRPGALDAAVAACANNIASNLVERAPADHAHAPLHSAMEDAARLAERFWLRAGNWVNHERAAYLRAMVGNALGQSPQAREHALRALALIDANDEDDAEKVDRAFIELERAHACRALELGEEASAAQARAEAIAATFGDAFLDDWFASRRNALAALADRAG